MTASSIFRRLSLRRPTTPVPLPPEDWDACYEAVRQVRIPLSADVGFANILFAGHVIYPCRWP